MGKRRVNYEQLINEVRATSKKPKNKGKHIGVEIECLSKHDRNEIAKGLIDAGLEKYIQVKTDGSLEDYNMEYTWDVEVCVIARQHIIANVVKKVCRVLKNYGCIVNDTCGLHVHLDMRKRSAKNVYKRLVKALPKLEKKVHPSRIGNAYCERNKCDDINLVVNIDDEKYYKLDGYPKASYEDKIFDAQDDYDKEKYLAINPLALREHNTIECRLHEGTLDSNKINKWVNLLVKIADGKAA